MARRFSVKELEKATQWRLAAVAQIEKWMTETFNRPYDASTRQVVFRRFDKLENFIRSFFPKAPPTPFDARDAAALIVLPRHEALELAREIFRGGPGIAGNLEAEDLSFNMDWFRPRDWSRRPDQWGHGETKGILGLPPEKMMPWPGEKSRSKDAAAWYHGSPIDGLRELRRVETPKRMDSAGLWFTSDLEFAAQNFGPHLYRATTKLCVAPAELPGVELDGSPPDFYWDRELVLRFTRKRRSVPLGKPSTWNRREQEEVGPVWEEVRFLPACSVRAWRNKQVEEGRTCFRFEVEDFDAWPGRQSILFVLEPGTIAVEQLR